MRPSILSIVSVSRTIATYLGPARYAGFDLVAKRVLWNALLVVVVVRQRMGAGPHHRHPALQNIDELRQFIQTCFANKAPHPSDASVFACRLCHVARPLLVHSH
jgi:hypothetical protein